MSSGLHFRPLAADDRSVLKDLVKGLAFMSVDIVKNKGFPAGGVEAAFGALGLALKVLDELVDEMIGQVLPVGAPG